MSASFDDEARSRLALLADQLIPAGDGMPSASEAGVAGEWLDAIVAAEPGFGPALASVLAEADVSDPAGALRRIETTDPNGWGTLTTVVAGAYFLNPAIAEQVGYPGRPAIPSTTGRSPTGSRTGCSTRSSRAARSTARRRGPEPPAPGGARLDEAARDGELLHVRCRAAPWRCP